MKKLLILILISISFYGCNKFLDIKPKGFTIPEYFNDYEKIMNEAQLLAKAGDNYPVVLTDDIQYSGLDSSNSLSGISEPRRRMFTFEPGDIFEQGGTDADGLWGGSYKRIYTFNTVINNVMKVEDASESEKKRLRAEAIVGRAFEFLTLVSAYAVAYDPATAAKDYGIPLILTEDVGDISYTRSSIAEVYARIQSDLEKAIPDLADFTPNRFRPAKNVGYAFRARMFLYMGEYEKALEDAKMALAISDELIDLNDYGVKSATAGIGRITKLPDLVERYPEGIENPENIYTRYAPSVFGFNNNAFASDDLLEAYDRDLEPGEIDMRRQLWFIDNSYKTKIFPGRSQWVQYIRSNVGLNNMETILIAAECHARKGTPADLQEAARLYNWLRKHRIKNAIDKQFANAEEALVKVLDERRREFPFLTLYRYVDLKRLNKDPRFAKTVTHTVDGNTWTLPPNDPRWVIPVPPDVKAFNPSIPVYDR